MKCDELLEEVRRMYCRDAESSYGNADSVRIVVYVNPRWLHEAMSECRGAVSPGVLEICEKKTALGFPVFICTPASIGGQDHPPFRVVSLTPPAGQSMPPFNDGESDE